MADRERTTEHALRATSDTLLDDLERLLTHEREKRTLEPGDPRREVLAAEVRELATRVLGAAVEQAMLTEEATAQVRAGSPTAPEQTIEETPPRSLHDILSEWRDAERRAAAAEPGSDEAASVAEEITRLRFEYRRAYEAAASDEA
ncbi:MAG TPA: hypothetical protein VEY67_10955 [Candidatus Dormibacteraeota bacterium]|nr:hypothetical protein [Candidatus Dormibacteraeota bacterium]